MFASKRVNSIDATEAFDFVILQVLKAAPWFKHCLVSDLNIQSGKSGYSVTKNGRGLY